VDQVAGDDVGGGARGFAELEGHARARWLRVYHHGPVDHGPQRAPHGRGEATEDEARRRSGISE
jgi:hypothetical protein